MKARRLLLLIPLAMLASGCQYLQERQLAADQQLVAKVRSALIAEPGLDPSRIIVAAHRREVSLRGSVRSLQEAAEALAIAQKASGSDGVDSSLAVKP